MRRVEVEVRDDIGHHEGGQAVILVTGLDHLDDGVTFFLRPLDAVTQEAGLGALDNEQRALSVRSVAGGVELVVGPDVTEHPALVAGSSVEIEIPEAGVWSEFQWPVVSARTRSRRTKIVANRPPLGEPAFELRTAPAAGRERREPPGLDDVLRGARASEARPAAQKTTGPVQEEATAMTTTQPAEKVPQSISDGPVDDPSHAEAQEFVVFYPYARGGKLGATATGPDRKSVV